MTALANFSEVLDAVDRLKLAGQEELVGILRRRIIDQRRAELALEIREAKAEYAEGRTEPRSAQELVDDILA
jgi:hypothetical protein